MSLWCVRLPRRATRKLSDLQGHGLVRASSEDYLAAELPNGAAPHLLRHADVAERANVTTIREQANYAP